MSGSENQGGAYSGINGACLSNGLMRILMADDIQPGSEPSYQLCKDIYTFHVLGAKIADEPIHMAMSQRREISIPNSPEVRVKEAFEAAWEEMSLDTFIFGIGSTARIYGVGSLIYGAVKDDGSVLSTEQPIDPWDLWKYKVYFSVQDPLNTSGSLVLNQDSNAPDFQKAPNIAVSGQIYHSSRSTTLMNERPIYIDYTPSTFGFSGRSVYQRILYPLKSFVNSMRTDDLVVTKAGLLVAKVMQPGSIANNIMAFATGVKRAILKEAQTSNVISIDPSEDIETLNMMNLDGAYGMARKDILENIAAGAPMPAIMLNSETYADGFGEGSEDAKKVAHFVNRIRMWLQPAYAFCDQICMYKAWTPAFYETIQADFPSQYAEVDYKTAFYQWKNSFAAEWPSLLIEPESEKSKAEDVKLKATIAILEVLLPTLDPENQATLIQFALDNFNALKMLFTSPALLDYAELVEFLKKKQETDQANTEAAAMPDPPKPEGGKA